MDAVFDRDKVYQIEFSPDCRVNVTDEVLLEQVAHSIRLGLPQAMPHDPNTDTVLLVAGGPSLNMPDIERELVRAAWSGGKVIAVNGAYQWCVDHNIRPSGMVTLDARHFSTRFVGDAVKDCTYFLASQCHPDAFERCRGRNIVIWHALSCGDEEYDLLKRFYFDPPDRLNLPAAHYGSPFRGHTFPVTMGCTVALRALSLLRMLWFLRFEIFGLDSCYLDDEHHAYRQPENDGDGMLRAWLKAEGLEAKAFNCSPWHCKQAQDFMDLVKERGELFSLNVHGPGLIATMIQTGAELEVENP